MMPGAPTNSAVLTTAREGDRVAADRLFGIAYEELRGLAGIQLRGERPGHSLQPADLVHEAYLRLVVQEKVRTMDRSHFIATASQTIRRVLLDHARRRRRQKRGASWKRIPLTDVGDAPRHRDEDHLDLDQALSRLKARDGRLMQVVALRFFGGLTIDEVARIRRVSPRSVAKEWRAARAWLRRELEC